MIKVAPYIILLLGIVVVPVLEKAAVALEASAAKTPDTYDDVLAGAFRTVVDALKTGGIFIPKTKLLRAALSSSRPRS